MKNKKSIFEPVVVKAFRYKHMSGGADILGVTEQGMEGSVGAIANKAWGREDKNRFDKLSDNQSMLFTYMVRRFGFPVRPCDDYKEIARWYLTTPMKGLFLSVYPMSGATGFGYICSSEIHNQLIAEYTKPIGQEVDKIKLYTLRKYKANLYTTNMLSWYMLPIKHEEKGKMFLKDGVEYRIAKREYEQWCIDNKLPKLPTGEDTNRFYTEFAEYKDAEIDKYVKLYKKAHPASKTKGRALPSKFVKDVIGAITITAQSLLRFTYIRDEYFNVLGYKTDVTHKQAQKLFGRDDMFTTYFNPNDYINAYMVGIAKTSKTSGNGRK